MPKLEYFPDDDVVYITCAAGAEYRHRDLQPNVTVEFAEDGTLLGLEILRATETLLALVQPLLDAHDPDAAVGTDPRRT